MSPIDILKIYGVTNLLIAVSYGLFSILRGIGLGPKAPMNYSTLTRLGQTTLVLACLFPLVMHQAPTKHLPKIHFEPGKSMGEKIESQDKGVRNGARTLPNSLPAANKSLPAVSTWHWPAWAISFGASLTYFHLLLVILSGITVMMVRFWANRLRLRSLLNESFIIRRIGRILITVSDSAPVPFSANMGSRRWVVLPGGTLENARDFHIALRHEFQHHRRRDTDWAVGIEFLTATFFLNPFIFLWKREITELQELSCDESLVGQQGISPHDYGSCLVRVAEAALGSCSMPVGTTGMAAGIKNPNQLKSFLRRRAEDLCVPLLDREQRGRVTVRVVQCNTDLRTSPRDR